MAVPQIVEKALRVHKEVERRAKRTYRHEVGRLHPIVPFVERDVPTGIYVWVGLVGPRSDGVLGWIEAPS